VLVRAILRSVLALMREARDLLAPIYGWFTEGFDTSTSCLTTSAHIQRMPP
jgi:hypothetical protein